VIIFTVKIFAIYSKLLFSSNNFRLETFLVHLFKLKCITSHRSVISSVLFFVY